MEEDNLGIRLRYSKGIAQFSQILYKEGPHSVQEALRHILNVSKASRVSIFQLMTPNDAPKFFMQTFESCAHGVETVSKSPIAQRLMQDLIPDSVFDVLLTKREFQLLVKDLPEPLNEKISEIGLKSFLLLPIFTRDTFWGMIGFDDSKNPRVWKNLDIDLLKIVAEMMGRFFEQRETQQKLQASEERYRTIFQQSPIGIFHFDQVGTLTSINSFFAEIIGHPQRILLA